MNNYTKIIFLLALTCGGIWVWKLQTQSTNTSRLPSSVTAPRVITKPTQFTSQFVSQNLQQKNITTSPEVIKMETERKIKILTEIIESKNDNDPRLDKEFKDLTSETKQAIESKYKSLQLEARNERGTLVFILGQNLNTKKDFDFLQQVLAEEPCLSLANCSIPASAPASQLGSLDDNNGVEVTLHYPQIVALTSIKNYLEKNPTSTFANTVLQDAVNSKSPLISKMALSIAHNKQ